MSIAEVCLAIKNAWLWFDEDIVDAALAWLYRYQWPVKELVFILAVWFVCRAIQCFVHAGNKHLIEGRAKRGHVEEKQK